MVRLSMPVKEKKPPRVLPVSKKSPKLASAVD